MIFDNKIGTDIYNRYYEHNDTRAITELIVYSQPLITVFARKHSAGNPELLGELMQVGSLKVYDLVRNRKLNPTKGKLYNLLSTSLPNVMIDCLRKSTRHDFTSANSLDDMSERLSNEGYHLIGSSGIYKNGDSDDTIAEFQQQTIDYAIKRFPSLPVAGDVGQYVTDALLEGAHKNKITKTVKVMFDVKQYAVYQAIRCRFAAALSHKSPLYEAEALRAVNRGNEFTTKPEMVLIAGPEVSQQLHYYMRM